MLEKMVILILVESLMNFNSTVISVLNIRPQPVAHYFSFAQRPVTQLALLYLKVKQKLSSSPSKAHLFIGSILFA